MIHPFPVSIFRCITNQPSYAKGHDRCESARSQGALSIEVQSSLSKVTSGLSFKTAEVLDTEVRARKIGVADMRKPVKMATVDARNPTPVGFSSN